MPKTTDLVRAELDLEQTNPHLSAKPMLFSSYSRSCMFSYYTVVSLRTEIMSGPSLFPSAALPTVAQHMKTLGVRLWHV